MQFHHEDKKNFSKILNSLFTYSLPDFYRNSTLSWFDRHCGSCAAHKKPPGGFPSPNYPKFSPARCCRWLARSNSSGDTDCRLVSSISRSIRIIKPLHLNVPIPHSPTYNKEKQRKPQKEKKYIRILKSLFHAVSDFSTFCGSSLLLAECSLIDDSVACEFS